MKEIIRISYPKNPSEKKRWNKEYGMNAYYAGKHWAKRKEDADYWHALTRAAMSKAQVRRRPFDKPVVITFLWNDRLDLDNHSIMSKMIIDTLKGRLINDDTRRWVKGIEHYWSNDDCIKVIIQEVDSDECKN